MYFRICADATLRGSDNAIAARYSERLWQLGPRQYRSFECSGPVFLRVTEKEGNRDTIVIRHQKGMQDDFHQSETLAQIRKLYIGPTLIQWGKEDVWIGYQVGHNLKKVFKGSKLLIYEGVGHIPQEEIPQITAKDVKEFLKK